MKVLRKNEFFKDFRRPIYFYGSFCSIYLVFFFWIDVVLNHSVRDLPIGRKLNKIQLLFAAFNVFTETDSTIIVREGVRKTKQEKVKISFLARHRCDA